MARKKPMKKATVKRATYPQAIDYTTMKVGTITRQWTYRKPDGTTGTGTSTIEKCPKCGRNGELRVLRNRKKGGMEVVAYRYDHVSEITEIIPGFPLNTIKEHCEVSGETPATEAK